MDQEGNNSASSLCVFDLRNDIIDKKYVWHPYTQMMDWNGRCIKTIASASGFHMIDERGNKILDSMSNMWCNVWGHSKKQLIVAMKKQLDLVPHSSIFGLASTPSLKFAERIVKIANGMHKVFFTDNGSCAIEVSLKIAVQYWTNLGRPEKTKFMSLKYGYHGDTIACMSVGYINHFFSPYQSILMNKIIRLPSPTIRHPDSNKRNGHLELSSEQCLQLIEKTLIKHAHVTAAFVMESGAQVAGGVRIYPEGFQKKLSELCKKYEVLVIFDEIATGLGRLGAFCEYISQKSKPDIVCYAKALTGGYFPLAVTLTTQEIFNAFLGEYLDNKHLFHGHTFAGHSVGCACAMANLELYKRLKLLDKIKENSLYLGKLLEPLMNIDIVVDIRHKGLLGAIELEDMKTGKPILKIGTKPIGQFIAEQSLKRGVYVRSLGNIIPIIPPLAISKKDLKQVIKVYEDIIKLIQSSLRRTRPN
ncbi:MAG TPA: adenosylmethionine--8-amino-7-oxononanoate transaminase [Nitrososphaeraceae archaeon]